MYVIDLELESTRQSHIDAWRRRWERRQARRRSLRRAVIVGAMALAFVALVATMQWVVGL